jgi:FHA domain
MPLEGRKSLRQFQCPDAMWNTVRRMAEEQEKGVDELILDALLAYAQLAGYQTGVSLEEPDGPVTPPPVRPLSAPRPRPLGVATSPPPPAPTAASPPRFGRPIPAPGSGLNAMLQPAPVLPAHHPGYGNHAPAEGAAAPAGVTAPPLYLVFDNQKYRIDKDQFIIGRGSKSSDLPIKDGNISRKHAAIIRRNGTYFIKDLGSTNGIDFKGMRIDNKRIDEGDVFHLCDYELRFTYKR